jgi:hypothetical protein
MHPKHTYHLVNYIFVLRLEGKEKENIILTPPYIHRFNRSRKIREMHCRTDKYKHFLLTCITYGHKKTLKVCKPPLKKYQRNLRRKTIHLFFFPYASFSFIMLTPLVRLPCCGMRGCKRILTFLILTFMHWHLESICSVAILIRLIEDVNVKHGRWTFKGKLTSPWILSTPACTYPEIFKVLRISNGQ